MTEIFSRNSGLVNSRETSEDGSGLIGFFDSYSLIIEFISVKDTNGIYAEIDTSNQNRPSDVVDGIDEFTWVFLEGARSVNLNANGFSDEQTAFGIMGREYNDAQFRIRFGEDANFPISTTQASDRIAHAILETVKDQGASNPFPSLFHLGHEDGQKGAAPLWFNLGEGPHGIGADIGGWAGTPFFALLNEPSFYYRDILHFESDNYAADGADGQTMTMTLDPDSATYQNATTYDLLALTQAFADVGIITANARSPWDSIAEAIDALDGAGNDGVLGENLSSVVDLIEDTELFLAQSYGLIPSLTATYSSSFLRLLGQIIPFFEDMGEIASTVALAEKSLGIGGKLAIGTNNAGDILGELGDDGIHGASVGDDVIHGGRGSDTIFGGAGRDIIDGGENFVGERDGENDTVDYRYMNFGLRFSVFDAFDLEVPNGNAIAKSYIGSVGWLEPSLLFDFIFADLLFGIETIVGSKHNDIFELNRLSNDLAIDGGEGIDALSFEAYDQQLGAVQLSFEGGEVVLSSVIDGYLEPLTISNIEALIGTKFGDTIRLDTLLPELKGNPIQIIDGFESFERGDLLDFAPMEQGVAVALQGAEIIPEGGPDPELPPVYENGEVLSGDERLEIVNFDDVVGTSYADSVVGSDGNNTVYAGGDADTIDGGAGHDDLHGGLGNDIIHGGDGADWLYDRGADGRFAEGQTPDEYLAQVMAYDAEGDDVMYGGAGADVFLYSGGTDVYHGGAGDDLYLATATTTNINNFEDNLTIRLSEDTSDPENLSLIGHDLVAGDGSFVDLVVFEGLNRSDVTITYEFEEIYLGSSVLSFDPIFISWFEDPDVKTLDFYRTVGSYEIMINATGSTFTVENVVGAFNRNPDNSPLASTLAVINSPFTVQFDDGTLDWTNSVLDPATNGLEFTNGTLSENAFSAVNAFESERSTVVDFLEGDQNPEDFDDEIYGTTDANSVSGGLGEDRLFGGAGDDLLIGGAGADYLDGGSGIDTVSYAGSNSYVWVALEGTINGQILDLDEHINSDGYGDEFESIENVVGSSFDDIIKGRDGGHTFWGGDGNDRLEVTLGDNTLHGGNGDDQLIVYSGGTNTLFGGDGDDELGSWRGLDDTFYGGEGNDYFWINTEFIGEPDKFGSDFLYGEAGTDSLTIYAADQPEHTLIVDLVAGTVLSSGIEGQITLSGIENITTDGGDDVIYGDNANNVLDGRFGDDLLYGGGGDDILIGAYGNNTIFGGTGIDTVQISRDLEDVTLTLVDGGVRIDTFSGRSNTVHDDVEFLQFADQTVAYADLVSPLLNEFDVVDDYFRIEEGADATISLVANDLRFNADPINVLSINGATVSAGDTVQFSSGLKLSILANGLLQIDQQGAFAGLDVGETLTQSFSYSATDSTGIEKTADVTLVFDGVASDPDALHLTNDVVWVHSNADGADMTSVANFDIARSVVIIDELFIDPNNPPSGVTIEEINGDTFVQYGIDDAIVLQGISLEAWQLVAAQRQAGASGNDVINGTETSEFLDGGAGNDGIRSGGGDDVIRAGSGDDVVDLGEGSFVVFGGAGNDEIGTGSYNGWYGDPGTGDDIIFGNEGHDYISGGYGNDELYGGSGDDTIYSSYGDDVVYGGDGDDYLYAGEGYDFYDGGDGSDTIYLSTTTTLPTEPRESTTDAVIDLVSETISWGGVFANETLKNIENVVGTRGNDLIIGNDEDNRLNGSYGDDVVYGGLGNDRIDDHDGDNELYGGAGDDSIHGLSAGVDKIFGGIGDDSLFISEGNDVVDGGEGSDTIDISRRGYINAIDLSAGTTGEGENIATLTSIENAVGNNLNNVITGSGEANILDGGYGADIIDARDGDDIVIGGSGDDTLTLGGGQDIVRLASESDEDTVTDFDIYNDVLEINGAIFNPNELSNGITISENSEGVTVQYGARGLYVYNHEYDRVTLLGVNLDDWLIATTPVTDSGDDNLAPTATDDAATVLEDGTILVDVLANDSDPDGDILTVTDVIGAAFGAATVVDGQILYTPNDDFNGTETLTYTAVDGRGGVANGVVTVTVTSENDAPVTADDSVMMEEDGSILIDPLTNDTDVDGDALVLVSATGATNGTVSIENGQLRYIPDPGFAGVETITYQVSDGAGGTATGTANITVVEANEAPVAVADTAVVDEDSSVLIDVTANDTDNNGDDLTIVSVAAAANGTVVIEGNQLRYTPTPDFNGTDSVTYTVEDGRGGSASTTVEITVNPVNEDPIALADVVMVAEDQDILIDVVSNDTDTDGGTIALMSVDSAINGTAVLEAGQIRFTPDADFNGLATITYTISDGQGGLASSAVRIDVTAVNDAPVAVADTAIVDGGETIIIDAIANDSDPEGDSFYITNATVSGGGTVNVVNGKLQYESVNVASSDVVITYTLSDGQIQSTGTVNVTVVPVNTGPIANSDTASIVTNQAVLIDVLANDTDADGDALMITSVDPAANGAVAIEGNQLRYVPDVGFTGDETLIYTISDGQGGSATASVQITVNPVAPPNSAPVAADDNASVDQDASVLIDVLSNDTDPDGDTLTITSVTASANGSAVIEGGSIRYTPNAGFSGSDTITYTVSDGEGGTATASVQVDVAAAVPAGAPIVVDDFVTVVSGGTILIDALANDSDPDGDGIYIANIAPTFAKSLQFVDGKILYEALDNYTGVVEMVYTVSDFGGTTSTGSVFIDVVAANSGPIANDDAASVDENGSVLIDVLANDDAGGGTLIITSVTSSANGSAVIEGGAIRYVPNAGFSGPDTITYEVSDGAGGTATASVQVEVAAVQDGAPIVVDDFVTVVSGGTILIDAIANDSHPDGVGMYISNVAPTIAQSLQFIDGKIQYEALDNYTGVVEMVYTVTDYGGVSSTGSVFIDVVAPAAATSQANRLLVQDIAPEAATDIATTSPDKAVKVDVLADGSPIEMGPFATTCFASPSDKSVVIDGNGVGYPLDTAVIPVMDEEIEDDADSFVFFGNLLRDDGNPHHSSNLFDAVDAYAEAALSIILRYQNSDTGSSVSGESSKTSGHIEAGGRSLWNVFDDDADSAGAPFGVDVFEWLI
jgi:Ca2+-binding RTX toxin-like protein